MNLLKDPFNLHFLSFLNGRIMYDKVNLLIDCIMILYECMYLRCQTLNILKQISFEYLMK